MLLVPAYGAIIGGWFGAWPMPLDWERPWQVMFISSQHTVKGLFLNFIAPFFRSYCKNELILILFFSTGMAYMCVLWSYRRLHWWTNGEFVDSSQRTQEFEASLE